jgi:CarboxypepD_reg-like domain
MKATKTIFILTALFFFALASSAQKKSATVNGQVLDENENPLPKVSVSILGREAGVLSNDSGYFTIKVPADKAFALTFSYTGYRTEMKKNVSSFAWSVVVVKNCRKWWLRMTA